MAGREDSISVRTTKVEHERVAVFVCNGARQCRVYRGGSEKLARKAAMNAADAITVATGLRAVYDNGQRGVILFEDPNKNPQLF